MVSNKEYMPALGIKTREDKPAVVTKNAKQYYIMVPPNTNIYNSVHTKSSP